MGLGAQVGDLLLWTLVTVAWHSVASAALSF
jgi:hypothetical protein